MPTLCAIVLAAGRSRRMGAQKLLLPLAGRPVIAHVVDAVLAAAAAAVRDVIVVTAADGDAIAAALAGRPRVVFVANPGRDGDMLGSVRCGLRAVPSGCDAVLVALGDQPGVRPHVIDRLAAAFDAGAGDIVLPTYAGRRGHPILFAVRYTEDVMSRYDGVGLRALLDTHPAAVYEVECLDPVVLMDVDDPADYQREVARFAAGGEGEAPTAASD